jgi:hypothetical protein
MIDGNPASRVAFASFSVEVPAGWRQYGDPAPVNYAADAGMHLRSVNFAYLSEDVSPGRLQVIESDMDGFEEMFLSGYLASVRAVEGAPEILPTTIDGVAASQVWRADKRNERSEYVVFRSGSGFLILLEYHTSPLAPHEVASARSPVGRFVATWRWNPAGAEGV